MLLTAHAGLVARERRIPSEGEVRTVEQGEALIGGRPVEASEAFDDVDPSTGRPIAQVARCS